MEANSNSKISRKITGLLLCAGLSGRMGTSKALMVYNGLPFAVLIIKKLLSVCNEVIIVVGHEADKVILSIKKSLHEKENNHVHFILNDNYRAGMFSSLQCGLKSIINADWILYHFVDQPSLPVSFYKEFVEQLPEEINWFQPSFNNKAGHPIFFERNAANIILKLSENSSLRDLCNDQRIIKQIWYCSYPEILQDVDTVEDFNNLNCDS
jgi:molybdenum cofactor cytidylyltransferase